MNARVSVDYILWGKHCDFLSFFVACMLQIRSRISDVETQPIRHRVPPKMIALCPLKLMSRQCARIIIKIILVHTRKRIFTTFTNEWCIFLAGQQIVPSAPSPTVHMQPQEVDPNVEYVKPKKVLVRSGPDDLLLDEEKNSSGLSTGRFFILIFYSKHSKNKEKIKVRFRRDFWGHFYKQITQSQLRLVYWII